jgi:hypothetical protein
MNAVKVVKEAIYEVFGEFISVSWDVDADEVKNLIDLNVFPPDEDPGQWAPHSVVVVNTERGIPSASSSMRMMEKWFEVDEIVQEYGYSLYGETINGAIHAFYRIDPI